MVGKLLSISRTFFWVMIVSFSTVECVRCCLQDKDEERPPKQSSHPIQDFKDDNTKVTYQNTTHENIQKEMGDDRILHIQRIIDQNSGFNDLLVFLSLINAQDIPLDLLYAYRNSELVGQFIDCLRKSSLLTEDKASEKEFLKRALSIHPSTQTVLYEYLISSHQESERPSFIRPVKGHLERYIRQIVETEDYDRMKLLISHGEVFLRHTNLFAPDQMIQIQGDVGKVLHYLGRYNEAQNLLEKTFSSLSVMHDSPEKARQQAQLLYDLGEIYGSLGKRDRSVQCFEESLELYQQHSLTDYKKLAQLQADLGNVYIQRNYARAKELLENSLTLYKTHVMDDYTNTAWVYLFLGYAEESQGHFMQAKKYFEHSLAVCQNHLPDKPVKLAWALANIGNMEQELGDYQRAKALLQQSYDLCQANLSDDHRGFAILRVYKGIFERGRGHYQEAEDLFTFADSIFQKLYPREDPWRVWVMTEQGILRRVQGHLEEAKIVLAQATRTYQKVYGDQHVKTALLLQELGLTYLLQMDKRKAQDLLEKSLTVLKACQHGRTYHTFEILSDLFLAKANEAFPHSSEVQSYHQQSSYVLHQAVESAKLSFPPESPHLQRIQAKLLQRNASD